MNSTEITVQATADKAILAFKECKHLQEAAIKIVKAFVNGENRNSDMIDAWNEGFRTSAAAASLALDPELYDLAEEALIDSVHVICLALEGSSVRYMTDEPTFRAMVQDVCFMGTSHIIDEFHEAICMAVTNIGVYDDSHIDMDTEDTADMALESESRNRRKTERVNRSIDSATACLDDIASLSSELRDEIKHTMKAMKGSSSVDESQLGSSICEEIRSTIKPADVLHNVALSCATNQLQEDMNS